MRANKQPQIFGACFTNYFILLDLLLVVVLFPLAGLAQAPRTTVVAFGSCDDQDKPQLMWPAVVNQSPDLWVWGEDVIYADTHIMSKKRAAYRKQKSDPGYQQLLNTCPVTGTWDDHDYGTNDSSKRFTQKSISKRLLLEFLNVPESKPVWNYPGVYSSYQLGSGAQSVLVLNLDTRYFRDPARRQFFKDNLSKRVKYRYLVNSRGDVLGDAQWDWLARALKNSSAGLVLINSSFQVLNEEQRFEKWANFPRAKKRLLDMIAASGKRVVIMSGDRHLAEISMTNLPGLTYPLYDFTSSGLTHTVNADTETPNHLRVGDVIIQKTFGLIKIDWSFARPVVTMQIRGENDLLYGEQVLDFNQY